MFTLNEKVFSQYLKEKYKIRDIRRLYLETMGRSNIFFEGNCIETGKKVFIKYDINSCGASTREAEILQLSKLKNSPYFPNVVAYEDEDSSFVISEFIEGTMLKDILNDLDLKYELLQNEEEKKKLLLQLMDIMIILDDEKIIHRDIHPQNIMVTKNEDGSIDRLILIDFSFSVGLERFPELQYLIDSKRLTLLGRKKYKPDIYKWDNQYSIAKVAMEIDENADREFPYIWKKICSFKEKLVYKYDPIK